jgi:hypothetical protein
MFRAAFILFPVLGLISAAWAAPAPDSDIVALKMKLEINGKLVSSPSVITRFGKKATISQSEADQDISYAIDVEPDRAGSDTVMVKFNVSEIQGGRVRWVRHARATVRNHQPASMSQTDDQGKTGFGISVTPSF